MFSSAHTLEFFPSFLSPPLTPCVIPSDSRPLSSSRLMSRKLDQQRQGPRRNLIKHISVREPPLSACQIQSAADLQPALPQRGMPLKETTVNYSAPLGSVRAMQLDFSF